MINKIMFEYLNGGFRPSNELFKEVITVKDNKFKYEKLYLDQDVDTSYESKYSKAYSFELKSDSEYFHKLFLELIDNLNLELKVSFNEINGCDMPSIKISFMEGNKIIKVIKSDGNLTDCGLLESAICLRKFIPSSEEMPLLIGGEGDDD